MKALDWFFYTVVLEHSRLDEIESVSAESRRHTMGPADRSSRADARRYSDRRPTDPGGLLDPPYTFANNLD